MDGLFGLFSTKAAAVEVKTDSLAAPADSAKVHAVTADASKH